MKIEDLRNRVAELIILSNTLLLHRYDRFVLDEEFIEFRVSALSFLKNTFGINHPFYQEFNLKVKKAESDETIIGRGILKAAKQEIEGGWLFTTKGIVSAEIFSDFIEMAEHLLNEGYKDAAAVMIGSTLEEHLRQFCNKAGIPIETTKPDGKTAPKKADTLNSELATASVYGKLDQKSVTTWLDLRNKAAHGKYNEYTKEQVNLMLMGVTDFMVRNSL